MPRDARSADFSRGNARITKAQANITPPIELNPDLSEIHGQDVDEFGGGDMVYPKNGGGKDDPVG